jgi:hypothetical protein
MNVLLLTSHSIAEYDDLRMLSDLGYDVFSIGAYTNPGQPGDDKRPALPDAPYHADFEALCWEQRARHDGDDPGFVIDWAKGDLHPAIVDWADAIIVHHFPEAWIAGQWPHPRQAGDLADLRPVGPPSGSRDGEARGPRDRPLFTQGAEPWELCG